MCLSCCRVRKLPPAPDRSDIYAKMEKFLKLPAGKLSELAGTSAKRTTQEEAWARRRRPYSRAFEI